MATAVYESAFPTLIRSGELSPENVRAILAFYSLVRQVNWCLDEIHRHVRQNYLPAANSEEQRLRGKLEGNEVAALVLFRSCGSRAQIAI